MKKPLYSLVLIFLFSSCSKSDVNNRNCRFLLNVGVNTSINLNVFPYSNLQFVSNSVYVPNVGNGGVIVTNSGTGYLAWDASDPNHTPNTCSRLEINGLEGTCGCTDANVYSLITGQPLSDPDLNCGLKAYRVEQSGNDLIISN
ncbi:Rieske (2Fe-2S) protein [Pontimicrobium aquaticum]|uniref:Ferredoxin subunit of nitrite reductase or a ring-hydroxylating dioxygenase n=1 Tax=Pontimicrobium aquaticum TaxID=2565367 RepID=A0A4U0F0R1_9FLAO|nr:hypothetical protein [Pontimicrobium aquaticum]TJY38001.1 hypothetical protein E5167_01720 [Pontimicrobium aquaticum]